MPRYFDRVRNQLATEVRSQRAKSSRHYRLGVWIDPYPDIFGSKPEKMVFAKLMQFKIPFNYQTFLQVDLPDAGINQWYRPDFVIPHAKIVIEIDGLYWHSQEDQIVKDAFKRTLYEEAGYKVIVWYDIDVEHNLDQLILQVPELRSLMGKGGRIFTGNEVQIDDSKGIRTANRGRTDYGKKQAKYSSMGMNKGRYSYSVL